MRDHDAESEIGSGLLDLDSVLLSDLRRIGTSALAYALRRIAEEASAGTSNLSFFESAMPPAEVSLRPIDGERR